MHVTPIVGGLLTAVCDNTSYIINKDYQILAQK